LGIEPWVTIFHWDTPQALEEQGGWTSRKMVDWFSEYAEFVTKEYGSKVKNWMIINEPLSYTGMGYMFGEMAPGKKGLKNFKAAAHHSVLCQAEGGRIVRKNVPGANIGTTFALSWIDPIDQSKKNIDAAKRMDAVYNRLFIEPSLGLGYPEDGLPYLKTMKKLYADGDEKMMQFDFDFVGAQYYYRTVAKKSLMPGLKAKEISPAKRGVPMNEMDGEIYPEGFYQILKKFDAYENVKKIIVTENGTCVKDTVVDDRVHDKQRIDYFETHLAAMLKAKNEGVKVGGYFVWSLTDNFEWDKGFRPRFGLVHVDFNTLQRTMKDSGYWFKEFLK
jgi:beta-glucosidase